MAYAEYYRISHASIHWHRITMLTGTMQRPCLALPNSTIDYLAHCEELNSHDQLITLNMYASIKYFTNNNGEKMRSKGLPCRQQAGGGDNDKHEQKNMTL